MRLWILGAAALIGCAPVTAERGPAGERGEDGREGAPGARGERGPAGERGPGATIAPYLVEGSTEVLPAAEGEPLSHVGNAAAECDPGDMVMTGGCRIGDPLVEGVRLLASHPATDSYDEGSPRWTCSATPGLEPFTLVAYAACLRQ